jgi:hypothetical protein
MLYKILEESILIELEKNEKLALRFLYLDTDFFNKLRSVLSIKGTKDKIPETCNAFTISVAGYKIEMRPDNWIPNTLH